VRLLTRLLAYEGDPTSTAGQLLLWSAAESLVPRRGAGVFNQALMELGSLVCAPREPRCDACPVQLHCGARLSDRESELPRARPKAPITALCEAAMVIRRGNRVFLRRCGEGERWAGLWDFPRFEWTGRGAGAAKELAERTRELTGLDVDLGARLTTIKHGVTRFRITLSCYTADWRAGKPDKTSPSASRWARPAELDAYPLSTTGRKISRLLLAVK
jgi:A/G-specific adenine glycosylase